MRTSLTSGLAIVALLGSLGIAVAQSADGQINRGAGEAQMPPSGAPPGAMQQSGPGTSVNDVPSPPASSTAATPAVTDPNTGGLPAGPIGATEQTMPSSLSEKNAREDQLPIMAQPLRLSAQDQQQIVQAVRDRKDVATAAVDAKPSTELSSDVELYDLPASVTEQVPSVRGYKFVLLPDKILLVSPPNRIVVGEIAKQ
jgi:hypothetical protein